MAARRPPPVFNAEFRQRVHEVKNTIRPTSPHLEKAFNELLLGQQITFKNNEYVIILKDFGITDDPSKNYDIQGFLQVVKYYVECWPVWEVKKSAFRNLDEETRKNWFKEFYAYLYLKIKDILDKDSVFPCTTNCDVEDAQDSQTQTETVANNPSADYSIVIEGPPKYLNTIVFASSGDDIVIKRHVEKPWDSDKLTFKEFLNCPYVKVNFEIGNISFSRANVPDFERYISNVNTPVSSGSNEHDETSSKIDEDLKCTVYTHYFIQKYFEQFLKMLEAEKSLIQGRKSEISTIIKEFLADLEETDKKKRIIGTNLSICFRTGNAKYFRTKQIPQKGVHYVEILTPKVQVSIKNFGAEQDIRDRKRVSFKCLNAFKGRPGQFLKHINSGCISYSCNFCSKVYPSYTHIGQHFNQEHSQEQDVICSLCKQTVDIYTLARARWVHDCKTKKESK